jgi:hypothetical protein
MIRKVEMERFTVISARPFDGVVASDQDFDRKPKYGRVLEVDARGEICRGAGYGDPACLGENGLMLFVEFDHGMIVRKGTERHTSRIIRLVIGNPSS